MVEEQQTSPNKMEEKTKVKKNDVSDDEDHEMKMKEEGDDVKPVKNEVLFSPELLGMYYDRLFPFDMLYSWLSYETPPKIGNAVKLHSSSIFSRREISFTIQSFTGDEVYARYKSFRNEWDFTNDVRKQRPFKIDIGAVFNHPPKDKNAYSSENFRPVQRELVFDIDLTDYDQVRRCGCRDAEICKRCWEMMSMAIKVMQRGLVEDFGFEHIAWFYSGRRGVHCWVCDEGARELSNEARSAVADYFHVVTESQHKQGMDLRTPLHPMLQRSYQILEPLFVKHILPSSGHGLLASDESCSQFLSTLPPAAQPVAEKLTQSWSSSSSTPSEKWHELLKHLSIFSKKHAPKSQKTEKINTKTQIETWKYETVFRYTYPRLDINVSKMQNHLLKSPFCVHPKTGRVCVPIDIQKVDQFDPFQVPTLNVLQKELDAYSGKDTIDWKKTSLKESFEYFEKEFLGVLQKSLRRVEWEKAEIKAAVLVDF